MVAVSTEETVSAGGTNELFARKYSLQLLVGGTLAAVTVGFGLAYPKENKDPEPWNTISHIIGFCYSFAWSISFYYQVSLNYRRKSTTGLSFDFVWLNFLGFMCYSIYNGALFWSETVRESYRELNDGKNNLVSINDIVFSFHAAGITLFTLTQMYFFGYDSGGHAVSRHAKMFILLAVVSITLFALLIGLSENGGKWHKDKPFIFDNLLSWLSLVYYLSYLKLFISTVKYIPQAWMNIKRRSTEGWAIGNVLLDFTGGSLSVAQLFVDGLSQHNMAGVVGNPAKFGLGMVSMVFDVLFMFQHFVLYPDTVSSSRSSRSSDCSEGEELLLNDSLLEAA